MSDLDPVREYYAANGEREWNRLENSADGAIEFAVTCDALSRHLPLAGRVLDLGGGPGRYAIWLAKRGFAVTLADLSAFQLDIDRRKTSEAEVTLESIVETDARNLSRWPDASFDAALSLGPFYHLIEPGDREVAAAELLRVVKPGAPVFVALITRYAFLRRPGSAPEEWRHWRDRESLRRVLETGVFVNTVPSRFTNGYGVQPAEVAPFFEGRGIETIEILASEGIAAGIPEQMAWLAEHDRAAFTVALETVIETAADPAILGMSNHLLYVGKKPDTLAAPSAADADH